MLDDLFQVRTTHVSLGKELMTYLMQYYTSCFISPKAHANTTQEEAVIKVNSFKIYKTCSRQALVKKEDSIPVQVYIDLSDVLNSNIQNILYKNIQQKNSPNIIAVDGTYSTMKASLCEEGYKSNKNGESVTPLITLRRSRA